MDAPTGSVLLPIWLVVIILSTAGGALSVVVAGIIQFVRVKSMVDGLLKTVENLDAKVLELRMLLSTKTEELRTATADLERDVAVINALRQEDRDNRQRVPTPVSGVEYVEHLTPPPFRPKKG